MIVFARLVSLVQVVCCRTMRRALPATQGDHLMSASWWPFAQKRELSSLRVKFSFWFFARPPATRLARSGVKTAVISSIEKNKVNSRVAFSTSSHPVSLGWRSGPGRRWVGGTCKHAQFSQMIFRLCWTSFLLVKDIMEKMGKTSRVHRSIKTVLFVVVSCGFKFGEK